MRETGKIIATPHRTRSSGVDRKGAPNNPSKADRAAGEGKDEHTPRVNIIGASVTRVGSKAGQGITGKKSKIKSHQWPIKPPECGEYSQQVQTAVEEYQQEAAKVEKPGVRKEISPQNIERRWKKERKNRKKGRAATEHPNPPKKKIYRKLPLGRETSGKTVRTTQRNQITTYRDDDTSH